MKYTGMFLLLAAMVATWSLSTRSRPIGHVENQVAIAGMTKDALGQLIRSQAPELGEVSFEQVYTELLKEKSKIRVHFAFRTTSPSPSPVVLRRGSALLVSSDEGGTWAASDLKLESPRLQFREGLEVKAGTTSP